MRNIRNVPIMYPIIYIRIYILHFNIQLKFSQTLPNIQCYIMRNILINN